MTSIPLTNAVCASHPESQATFSCPRCGAFTCEVCRISNDGGLCGACAARMGTKRTLEVGEALEAGVLALTKRPSQAFALVGLYVATALLVYPLSGNIGEQMAAAGDAAMDVFVASLPRVLLGGVLGFFAISYLYGVFIRFEASIAAQEERPLMTLLRDGVRITPQMLAVTLLFSLALTAAMIMCLVPAFIIGPALALSLHAVALGGSGPVDGLGVSWKLTRGHRHRVFVLSLAMGVLAVVMGLLNLGMTRAAGPGLLTLAFTNAVSGFFMVFALGALGEAYRQLGVAQIQRSGS